MLIPNLANTATITDMREKALELLKQVEKRGPTYLFYRSRPKAVLLPIEEYTKMTELLEDYFDSQLARKLEAAPEKGGMKIEAVMKKYKIEEPAEDNV